MQWLHVVAGEHPVVALETEIIGQVAGNSAEMPLPDHTGGITRCPQSLGQQDFISRQLVTLTKHLAHGRNR